MSPTSLDSFPFVPGNIPIPVVAVHSMQVPSREANKNTSFHKREIIEKCRRDIIGSRNVELFSF